MTELKDWIAELKTEKPEQSDFITKLEAFISDTGFNAVKFENAVKSGLQKKEEEITKTLKADAESKEDNN
jgi:hypothetical protein